MSDDVAWEDGDEIEHWKGEVARLHSERMMMADTMLQLGSEARRYKFALRAIAKYQTPEEMGADAASKADFAAACQNFIEYARSVTQESEAAQ